MKNLRFLIKEGVRFVCPGVEAAQAEFKDGGVEDDIGSMLHDLTNMSR
jgi:hypothetical protein